MRSAGPVAYAATIAALLLLLGWALVHPDLPQFDGKAMTARLVTFPIAAAIVPIGWLVVRRHRGPDARFPWAGATLLALPFVIDLYGNAASLYVDIEYFDDAVHTLNPILGVAGAAILLDRTAAPRWSVVVMAFGLGSTAHVCFELIEYLLLVRIGALELGLTLADTLSDLGWGLVGSAAGACTPLLLPSRGAREVRPDGASGI